MTTTETTPLPPGSSELLPHDDGAGRPLRTRPVWLALLAASLPMFMATLDNLVMTGALPVISERLHPDVEQLQWFVNAYTLVFATLMLPAAALGDRFGRRRVFVGGIVLFALASAASALADTPAQLIAARAVQGAGGAAILPLSLALLAGAVPASRRAMAIGIWGGVSGLGVALGPVIGGAVVEGLSWRAIFWLNVPVAVVAVPLAVWGLREARGRVGRFDLVGLVLAGAGIFLAVWAVVGANDRGWGSVTTVGMLLGGAVLLAAFVRHETRAESPLVPLRLFRARSFTVSNVAGFAFSMGMFGAVFLLTQYLQIGEGYSPLAAGARTLPWTAAPMLVAPVAGALTGRFGARPFVAGGLVLQTISLAWMAVGIDSGGAYPSLVPAFVVAGVGMGLTFAPVATAVLADLPDRDHTTASSVNATIREVGVALGVAVLTAVFLGAGGAFTPAAYVDGLVPALWVGAAVVGVGAVASLLMPRRTGRAD
ncbi:MFS transporter [Luteimicrobium subarcticum]|uniref:EmrB/QacA subfamily drug resistance transporter n=1 Tax=Luteimicrobium subarcticum TaxID=620910 RepID=A0A2M8WTY3_9MICO|nr:MFS transporter [Luteimicrobium subarcticum]PJI94403.1 EmrB/QacA subfamily drug resistance transporter [Luteimicrobium subarcticum]